MNAPVTSGVVGDIRVCYHLFFFAESFELPTLTDRDWVTGLMNRVGAGTVFISTGIAMGPVAVTIRLLDGPTVDQEDSDWNAIGEVSIATSTGEFCLAVLMDDVPEQFEHLVVRNGLYRLRVHARGRDNNIDLQVNEPTETYLLDFWPSSQDGDPIIVKSDQYERDLLSTR